MRVLGLEIIVTERSKSWQSSSNTPNTLLIRIIMEELQVN